MRDAELLATYLRRRYRGRVELLLENKRKQVTIAYKRRTIEFYMFNGEVEVHWRPNSNSVLRKTKFHMATPTFKEDFDKFLLGDLRLQFSKLKADF